MIGEEVAQRESGVGQRLRVVGERTHALMKRSSDALREVFVVIIKIIHKQLMRKQSSLSHRKNESI